MKLTNGEIFEARGALRQLLSIKLPVQSALQIAKLSRALVEPLATIDAVRNPAVMTYGKPTGQPGEFRVDNSCEHWPEYQAEIAELMSQEVEVEISTFKLPEMATIKCKCGNVIQAPLELEPSILLQLERFIEWG